jgi:DNA polymerase-3 subunit delta'
MSTASAVAVLADKMTHQPRARVALTAALATGPSHAYLFRGPGGAGKRAAARAFAAEILARGAEDPEDARRRALLDPSPHPDLVWLTHSGAQHLVEDVRERVIRAAAYRPFEGSKRVFVIEAAEAMRDESQNALLKTLEEPPGFVHLILLTCEPAGLLETIASRCQPVDFAPLPLPAVEATLRESGAEGDEVAAAARLSAGDADLARFLLSEPGQELRAIASGWGGEVGPGPPDTQRASASGELVPPAPWRRLLEIAEAAGEEAEAATREALEAEKEAGVKRSARDVADEAKRAGRRRRTELLDGGLGLAAAWFRDLAATASGAGALAYNRDRLAQLESQAANLDPNRARRAAELVQDTRRRLDLNVSEELALEALSIRLQRLLGGRAGD